MGPCGNNMPEKDTTSEVIEFKDDSNMTAGMPNDNEPKLRPGETLTKGDPVVIESHPSPEPKPFTWMGVKFPAYFKGPHFVQVKGSIVLAIDPDCVSMEMRTNWQNIYVPELAALGKKIIEKHLKIKIENLD